MMGQVGSRFLLGLCAFVVALAARAAEAPGFEFAPEPAWVQALAVPDGKSTAPTSDGTRYLLVSDQLDLAGTQPQWYRRISYRVGQERGLAEAGRITIAFQPAYQRLQLHRVEVWREGARQDRTSSVSTQMLRREEDLDDGIFDGRRSLAITIPDLRVGDRIDYSFSVIGDNPVFGDDYYDSYAATYTAAVALRHVGARYPESMPLHWKVTHDAFRTTQGREGSLRTVDIRAVDLPPVREEDRVPASHDAYGRIEFSTAADWGAVSRWAQRLYPIGFRDRAVAERMVRELSLHDEDKLAVLERAIGFVQGQIRYTALDLGTNSHAPYRPETVIARRFGDCKDKALLLASLLAEAGIRAEPVLVDTDGGEALPARLPSAGVFDHVVLRAFLGHREIWVDATRDRESGPIEARSPLPFGHGLPVCRDCADLVEIPAPPPARPQVDVGEFIAISERTGGFAADFTVVTDYRNERAAEVRSDFAYSREDVGRNYLKYMRGFYEGLASAATPSAEDTESGGLRTRERYALDWDSEAATEFGIVLFQLLDFVPDLPREPRLMPLALTGPAFARHVVRVDWPKGFSIEPEHEEIATPWFRLTRDVRIVDGKLQVAAEWRRLATVVPAGQYAEAQARLQEARDLLVYDITLGGGLAQVLGAGSRWAALAVLLAMLVVPVLWRLRRHSRFLAMLFAPRETMPSILAADRRGVMWAILLAWAYLEAVVDRGTEMAGQGNAAVLLLALLATIGLVFRQLIFTWLLGWVLRLLRTRKVEFDTMLAAVTWGGGPPMIVFLLLGLVATGGDLATFAKAEDPRFALGAVVGGLLIVVGSAWSLVGITNAVSAVLEIGRRRVVAALSILLLVAALIVGAVFWLLL